MPVQLRHGELQRVAGRLKLVAGAVAALALALALGLPAVGTGAADGPALAVDATADQHAISPDIYGLNFADGAGQSTLAADIGLPVDRWGGNTTDTYNWQLGSANQGN